MCLLSLAFLNRVMEVIARGVRQGKHLKGTQIGNEEIKASLSSDYIIVRALIGATGNFFHQSIDVYSCI